MTLEEIFVIVLLWICFNGGSSHPCCASYKENSNIEPVEMTTTPKTVKDKFPLKLQVMPIPQNDSKKTHPEKFRNSKFLNDDVLIHKAHVCT